MAEHPQCPICFEEVSDESNARVVLPCTHGFHHGCLERWASRNSSCPQCRRELTPDECAALDLRVHADEARALNAQAVHDCVRTLRQHTSSPLQLCSAMSSLRDYLRAGTDLDNTNTAVHVRKLGAVPLLVSLLRHFSTTDPNYPWSANDVLIESCETLTELSLSNTWPMQYEMQDAGAIDALVDIVRSDGARWSSAAGSDMTAVSALAIAGEDRLTDSAVAALTEMALGFAGVGEHLWVIVPALLERLRRHCISGQIALGSGVRCEYGSEEVDKVLRSLCVLTCTQKSAIALRDEGGIPLIALLLSAGSCRLRHLALSVVYSLTYSAIHAVGKPLRDAGVVTSLVVRFLAIRCDGTNCCDGREREVRTLTAISSLHALIEVDGCASIAAVAGGALPLLALLAECTPSGELRYPSHTVLTILLKMADLAAVREKLRMSGALDALRELKSYLPNDAVEQPLIEALAARIREGVA